MLWDPGESGSAAFNNTDPSDNISLSCAARNIQGPIMLPYSTAVTVTVRAVSSIYFIVLLFGGAFLNILVIVLVAKYKQLQTYAFGIALQVIVLNLLLLFLTMVALANVVSNQWVFGEHMCAIVGLLLFILTSERTLIMLVFVIDRFLSIFCPFFYPKHKVKIIVTLLVASWIFVVISNIMSFIFDCYTFSVDTWICGPSVSCNGVCATYHGLIYTSIHTPAAIFPVILYIILYVKAKRVMKKTKNTDLANSHQREWRLTITFFLLFITVFALFIPGATISIIASLYPTDERPAVLYIFSTFGGELTAAILLTDPLVIMRHEEVRKIRSKIFGDMKTKLLTAFSSSTQP